ncbi:NADPH-dependent oxidoreductase [Idiomarina tyrosinivorans]|uniref:NADPH-dependent oxidoreductase n=1 Tax=Idiomarina tyrosinivorans TaxID=1445662 RepID=A0A432ZQ19_9GAMM|nr:NAD(P)H-dependent oxidoreductase [Idiomarina tyrosinivorans]RUO79941.1 NADPH-dependent oxidoreductase [Idiomarina tyrosinivorans]
MSILILAASRREASLNKRFQKRIHELALANDINAECLSADALDAPIYHGDDEDQSGVPESMQALGKKIAAADKVVIVTPEYNASIPPLLKNAIDWTSRLDSGVWKHKKVLLAAASPGALGGIRGLSHLRDILGNVLAWTAPLFASCRNASDETIAAMDDAFLLNFLRQGDDDA